MHTIAAKAVALKIAATEPFAARQRQTIANAKALAAGLEADGIPVLTGGTDVHLVLVDLTPTGLDGQTAEDRLEAVGITVNRNAIPFDERPPMNPSGLRIGTPALTTRGMVEEDMTEIAAVIAAALGDDFEAEKDDLSARTGALMDRYPLYPQLSPRRLSGRRLGSPDAGLGRLHRRGASAGPAADRSSACEARARGLHHRSRVRADGGDPRAAGDALHGGRRARREPRSWARRGRSAGARRGWRGWSGGGGPIWRSPTARSTWRSSPAASGCPRCRCRTTSSRDCSARSPSGSRAGCSSRTRSRSTAWRKLGAKGEKLVRYPGLKEEYYLADFEPDPAVMDELGLDGERVLVVVRPPPETSEYHARNDLYGRRSTGSRRARPVTVLIPRTDGAAARRRSLGGVS